VFAIIETGGKQYTVEEGSVIFVEKLPVEEGESVSFDKVLFLSDEEGAKVGANPMSKVLKLPEPLKNKGKAKKLLSSNTKQKRISQEKRTSSTLYTSKNYRD